MERNLKTNVLVILLSAIYCSNGDILLSVGGFQCSNEIITEKLAIPDPGGALSRLLTLKLIVSN